MLRFDVQLLQNLAEHLHCFRSAHTTSDVSAIPSRMLGFRGKAETSYLSHRAANLASAVTFVIWS